MELLAANLAALRAVDPQLALRVEAVEAAGTAEVTVARSGAPTVSVVAESGKRLMLHSRLDPEKEARRLVDAVDTSAADSYLVIGFGFGYHVRSLFRASAEYSYIFVVEKSLELFKLALENVDLVEVISSRRVRFMVGLVREEILLHMRTPMMRVFMGAQLVIHRPSYNAFPTYYKEMRSAISDLVKYTVKTFHTIFAISHQTKINLFRNLPYYLFCPGINDLWNRFAGRPAVVVSAGPSLGRNMHLLGSLKGKAVIIAVGTALMPLLKSGVVPDLTATLDFHRASKRFFEDADKLHPVPLVLDPKANWHAVAAHKGPKLVIANEFLDECLQELGLRKAPLTGSATVAHLAFYMAEFLGADPIIFVGQDLSHPYNISHMPGTAYQDSWWPELNRFDHLEGHEWDFLSRFRDILFEAEDIHGNPVFTDEQMFHYMQQFERDFHRSKARIIDATEGGLKKRNTEIMSLAEARERFCSDEIPAELYDFSRLSGALEAERLGEAIDVVEKRMREMREIRDVFERSLELLRRIRESIDDQPLVNSLIARVDELRKKAASHQLCYKLIRDANTSGEWTRLHRDKDLFEKGLTGIEKQRAQAERDVEFLESLVHCASVIQDHFEMGRKRLDEITPEKVLVGGEAKGE